MDSLEFVKKRIKSGIGINNSFKLDGEFYKIPGYSFLREPLPEYIKYDPDAEYETCFTEGLLSDGHESNLIKCRDYLMDQLYEQDEFPFLTELPFESENRTYEEYKKIRKRFAICK